MRPLKANEIELRIGSVGKNGVSVLCYKDARVDRQMLDEEFGRMNWQDKYRRDQKGILFCSIGVYDELKGEWIWKEDCGVESNTEKEKGEASDAFKRAGFRWGIGIELYNSPNIRIPVPTEEVSKGRYQMKNRWELFGMYVSRVVTEDNAIKEMDIVQNDIIIWSTNKKKEGLRVKEDTK